MRTILYSLLLSTAQFLTAQTATKEQIISDLPEIEITEGINLHIISPEPIQYVDLSTQKLTGDLPATNIARIKITDNPDVNQKEKIIKPVLFSSGDTVGIITVVGQSFIAQYKAIYRNFENPIFIFSPKICNPLSLIKWCFLILN